MEQEKLSCMFCHRKACETGKPEEYPGLCLTTTAPGTLLAETLEIYRTSGIDRDIAIAAAEIEGEFYGRACRAEEIIRFAKKIGAKKIGIASCVGLLSEAQTFCKILEVNGLQYFGAACKMGAVDKTEIGLCEEQKIHEGEYEPICNPILQAKMLNEEGTDLNVVVGLCVGHDSLFYKYSEAPVTTFITKDRVMGHNPAAAVYQANTYYKRLVSEKLEYQSGDLKRDDRQNRDEK